MAALKRGPKGLTRLRPGLLADRTNDGKDIPAGHFEARLCPSEEEIRAKKAHAEKKRAEYETQGCTFQVGQRAGDTTH